MSKTQEKKNIGPDRGFPTTRWSVVLAAGRASPESRQALTTLCETYWYMRTGADDKAKAHLELHLDKLLVGIPFGEGYPQLTERCQRALCAAKIYRSRFPFQGEITPDSEVLHRVHVPQALADVPLLPADHEWISRGALSKVREMPAAPAKQ
jgi:hypothetical protein